MMGLLSFFIGAAILAAALVDMLWTTLWVSGEAGPITGRLSAVGWRLTLARVGRRHRVLSLYGPASIVGAVVVWSAMLWAGWAMLFAADPAAVLDTTTGLPGDFIDRLYFTGYAIFTMGNGDLGPGPGWRIATVLMNASGLVLLTLVLSYLVSVISAVVGARSFAAQVTSLGVTGAGIVRTATEGGHVRNLELPLLMLSDALSRLSEQHAAYPVLRYFHAAAPAKSVPLAVHGLDDALTLISALPQDRRPSSMAIEMSRAAIDGYCATVGMGPGSSRPTASTSPTRDVQRPAAGDLPLEPGELERVWAASAERRARIVWMLERYGWEPPSG